eukprot:g2009.t1
MFGGNGRSDQALIDLMAGCACGATTRLFIAPLDVVKIKLQTQVRRPSTLAKYRNFPQTLARIISEEGIIGAWRGNTAAEALFVSYTAVQFTTFHGLKRLMSNGKKSSANTFICGSTAGITAGLATYPFDLLRTQMAVRGRESMRLSALVGDNLRRKGVRGLFRGLAPSLVQTGVYMGLNFTFYEAIVDLLRRTNRLSSHIEGEDRGTHFDEGASTSMMAVSGAIAGMLSKFAAYPLDTIKKRMQAQQIERSLLTEQQRMSCTRLEGMRHCFRLILAQEGVIALYSGVGTAMLKSSLAAGLAYPLFGLFESCFSDLLRSHKGPFARTFQ